MAAVRHDGSFDLGILAPGDAYTLEAETHDCLGWWDQISVCSETVVIESALDDEDCYW